MSISNADCGYKCGMLPECAPLALARVPMQQSSQPQYKSGEALSRGTLFPGLDLPFMNVVNTRDVSDTPLGEIQAIDFVVKELQLYLDSHSSDTEAFDMLKSMLKLSREAKKRYTAKYGPLCIEDLENADSYDWVNNPWPWDYTGKEA